MLSLKYIMCLTFGVTGITNMISAVADDTKNIDVVLNYPMTRLDNEIYFSEFIFINKTSTLNFTITNKNKNISFIIFQVHSHLYDVTLYNNTATLGSTITGTNLGLYSLITPKIDTFHIENNNEFGLKLLVTVLGYSDKDPIPGGCNLDLPISTSPFLRATFLKDYIFVDAAAPKHKSDERCAASFDISIEFYMLYLPEKDFTPDTYFAGIKNMMTLRRIRENGDRIPQTAWSMRRMLSAYPGTGAIYVAVASYEQYYSVYVPNHSYACSPSDEEGCEILDDFLSKFLCAILLFVGLFVCYFGHRFFKTEMFLFGMLSGVIVTYITIARMADLDSSALLFASVISGLFFGAIWLTFWWFYGIPVIAVSCPALILGTLVSCIVYNKLPESLPLLQRNSNWWIVFVLITILIAVILVSLAFVSNILCCAVIGSYAVIFPIDFYFGSNLKYIVINAVRRATVSLFKMAVLITPFQWRDLLVIMLWVFLAVSGCFFQHIQNKGRSPFPPPPRSVRPGSPPVSGYGAVSERNRNEGVAAPSSSYGAVTPDVTVSTPVLYSEKSPLLA